MLSSNGGEKMELSEIIRVEHTSDLKEVNDMLKNGWRIINTYTVAPYPDAREDLRLVYALGNTK